MVLSKKVKCKTKFADTIRKLFFQDGIEALKEDVDLDYKKNLVFVE